MTRLATVPFEVGITSDFSAPRQMDGSIATGTVSLQTGVVRSGARALKCDSGASAAAQCYYRLKSGDVSFGRGYWLRLYVQVSAYPASDIGIIDCLGQNASTQLVLVVLRSTGKLALYNWGAGAYLGSDSVVIGTNVWNCVEVYIKTATGANDETELRLNGTTVASGTGLTIADVAPGRYDIGWRNAPGASKLFYADDMAINDDQGSSQNSWPGPGSVVWAQPVSDNARGANWTGGAGGTTSLFDALNNIPPVGVVVASATNTSQIVNAGSSATSNYDMNVQDYATAGVPAGAAITVVQAFVDRGTSVSTMSEALQIVSNPAQGSEDTGTTNTGAVGTWASGWETYWGTAQYGDVAAANRATQPVVRYGKRTATTNVLTADAAGLYVEYVPRLLFTGSPDGGEMTGFPARMHLT